MSLTKSFFSFFRVIGCTVYLILWGLRVRVDTAGPSTCRLQPEGRVSAVRARMFRVSGDSLRSCPAWIKPFACHLRACVLILVGGGMVLSVVFPFAFAYTKFLVYREVRHSL